MLVISFVFSSWIINEFHNIKYSCYGYSQIIYRSLKFKPRNMVKETHGQCDQIW
jgi:hypothetical protein